MMVNGIRSAEGDVQAIRLSKQNISQSPTDSSLLAENKTDTDTVNVSSKAKLWQLATLFPSAESGTVSIEDIQESLSNKTSFVEQQLQSLYRQFGISPNSPMEISVGCDGSILVNGKSQESDRLSQAINADDELSNSIRGMSADTELLQACKNHEKFVAAYNKDSVAALERYGFLFEDGHGYDISFFMQNGHIDTRAKYT
jgi:hypothetical protein